MEETLKKLLATGLILLATLASPVLGQEAASILKCNSAAACEKLAAAAAKRAGELAELERSRYRIGKWFAISDEQSGSSLGKGDNHKIQATWRGNLVTPDMGFCFLTKVGGNLNNKNLYAQVLVIDGVWTLNLEGGGTEGGMRCFIVNNGSN